MAAVLNPNDDFPGKKSRLSQLAENLVPKLLMLMFGLILFVSSTYLLFTYFSFKRQAVEVSGTIEKPLWGGDLGGRPFIEYRDASGQMHGFKAKAKTHWFFAPQKGESIRVFYLEQTPGVAIVDDKIHYVVMPLFFAAIGGLICVYVVKYAWQEFKSSV